MLLQMLTTDEAALREVMQMAVPHGVTVTRVFAVKNLETARYRCVCTVHIQGIDGAVTVQAEGDTIPLAELVAKIRLAAP